ncbi:hypothetical protein Q7P37_002579 [Cladosporium fusiforme]
MTQRTFQGSCLCKGVQFSMTGQDKGGVLCHCINCKKFHGSAFAHNYRMMNASVEYQKGEKLAQSYPDKDTKGGKVLERFFCSKCGSSLYVVPEASPGLMVLCTGSIDGGDNSMKPAIEFFGQDRRKWMSSVGREIKL